MVAKLKQDKMTFKQVTQERRKNPRTYI